MRKFATAAWFRVSKDNPCPVCEHTDWCQYTEENFVLCMRAQNSTPSKGKAGGWLHNLSVGEKKDFVRKFVNHKKQEVVNIDAASIFQKWQAKTDVKELIRMSELLHVEPMALHMMGCAWAPEHGAWAFPMRDASAKIVGLRLRNENGEKWAVKGSKAGLFFADLHKYEPLLYIVEGPTDCAAAISLGLSALGRPSCLGSEDLINFFIKRNRIARVVIIPDIDTAKVRPDGSKFYPGQEGAAKLQESLKVPSIKISIPAKDFRDFYKRGGTKLQIELLCKHRVWVHPKKI